MVIQNHGHIASYEHKCHVQLNVRNETSIPVYEHKFGACASSFVFLHCTVKDVAISDICLPVCSDSNPCEGKTAQVQ